MKYAKNLTILSITLFAVPITYINGITEGDEGEGNGMKKILAIITILFTIAAVTVYLRRNG